ncbi:hypothetical protein [Tsuneonella sp. HG222]
MRKSIWLAVLCLWSFEARAEETALQPSSPWVVDYADERCSLLRTFGENDEAVRLQIDSYGRILHLHFLVSGNPIKPARPDARTFTYKLPPHDYRWEDVPMLVGVSDGVPAIAFDIYASPPEAVAALNAGRDAASAAEELAFWQATYPFRHQIEAVELRLHWSRIVTLETGSMKAPFAALEGCVSDLQRSWGLEPEVQNSLTRLARVKATKDGSVKFQYPGKMLRKGLSEFVPVRLMIDATGRATDCIVQIEQVDPAFRDAVCKGMMTDYEPALDSKGTPVASVLFSTIQFNILR